MGVNKEGDIVFSFGIHKDIKNMFLDGSTCTVGQRGTGKDMLMANIAVRRNKPYVSNINYDGKSQNNHTWLDLTKLDCGNDCHNFISGNVNNFEWAYQDGTDIYISDSSVYFPNYKTLELNKKYEGVINTLALSRQLGEANFHINCQNLARVWEKLPEQSDLYILCNKCKVLGKIVIQRVTVYQKRQSIEARIPPLPRPHYGLKGRSNFDRQAYELQRISYQAQHGEIKEYNMVYINKSNYDTRRFKAILRGDNNV